MNVNPGEMFVVVQGRNKGLFGTSKGIAPRDVVIAALKAAGHFGNPAEGPYHHTDKMVRWFDGDGAGSLVARIPFIRDVQIRRIPPPAELGLLDEVIDDEVKV